jgi:transcriptional regulator with XRE-family HTH domain
VRLDASSLRLRRTLLGLTQEDLAARAGVSVRTVNHAEAGRSLSPTSALCITTVLGMAYAGVVQSAAEAIEKRLHLSGYAALPNAGPFIGRRPLLDLLARTLTSDDGAAVCLYGLSGMGKTALLRQLVAEVRDRFSDGVIWVEGGDLGERSTRLAAQGDIAEALGFGELLPNAGRISAEAYDAAFAARLFTLRRLLILDDLDDLDGLGARSAFVPRDGASWVITTTARRPSVHEPGWHYIELGPLEPEEAHAVLVSAAGKERLSSDPTAVERLLEGCAGTPAALHVAGRLIARDRFVPLGDVVARLLSKRHESPGGSHWHRHLDPAASTAALGLRIFGFSSFTMAWASVATGLDERAVRRLLGELHDLLLVDEVPASEPEVGDAAPVDDGRFRVAGRAAALLGPAPEVTEAQLSRCLALIPRWHDGPLPPQVARLAGDLPLWRCMLDAAADQVLSEPHTAPLGDLDQLPAPQPGVPESAASLVGDPLMPNLVRYLAPRQSPRWIAAAMALARRRQDDSALSDLAALYGWWWFARTGASGVAHAWLQRSCEAALRGGDADSVVMMGCHAAIFGWIHRGHVAAAEQRKGALEVSRDASVRWQSRASALISAAVSRALLGDPGGALEHLGEAAALVPDADASNVRLTRAALTLNMAVCQRLLSHGDTSAEAVNAAIGDIEELVLGHYPLSRFRLASLARWLGAEPVNARLTAREALLSAPPAFRSDALSQLIQLCGELGVPVAEVAPEAAAVVTNLGPLSRLGITTVRSDRLALDLQLDVLSPVGALRTLLDRDHVGLALEFVDQVASPEHVLRPALAALVERGGLASDPPETTA